MKANKNKERLSVIKDLPKHTLEDLKNIAKWIRKYTEGYWSRNVERPPIGHILRGLLSSPDYSLKDCIAIFKNGTMKNNSLLIELMEIDLSEILKRIIIPYFILQGDRDIIISTKNISHLIKTSENRNLSFNQVENSGHYPSADGMDI